MANWGFTDDYGSTFPALAGSYLGMLVFSDHVLKDGNFSGTLDVDASGSGVAALTGLATLKLVGTVAQTAGDLTVQLAPADATALMTVLAAKLPVIGGQLRAASLAVQTKVTAADAPGAPQNDSIVMALTVALGSRQLVLSAPLPLQPGAFSVAATSDVSIQLEDLALLMGSSAQSWFPGSALGPFYNSNVALSLLGLAATFEVASKAASVTLSSVSAEIGIRHLALMQDKLYLDPLGVQVLMTFPDRTANWTVRGTMALCNAGRPGDLARPDLTLPFTLDLSDFSVVAQLSDSSSIPFNTILQDLLGKGVDVGLSDAAALTGFGFQAAADKTTGAVKTFSAELAASEPFGCFKNFDVDLQRIGISVSYTP